MQELLTDEVPFTALAVYGHVFRDVAEVSAAASYVGLTVLELPEDPAAIEVVPAPGIAWRCPLGSRSTCVGAVPRCR